MEDFEGALVSERLVTDQLKSTWFLKQVKSKCARWKSGLDVSHNSFTDLKYAFLDEF